MLIYVKMLNSSATAEVQLEVSPLDTILQIKSRLAEQLQVPVNQQKLVSKGKPLNDGMLRDHQIIDGSKLHLIVATPHPSPATSTSTKPANSAFVNELRLLASKWLTNPTEREAFITAFQMEMKNAVDRLSLDDIEKLCADRLNASA